MKKDRFVYCSECLMRVPAQSAKHYLLTQSVLVIGSKDIRREHVQKMYACSEEHNAMLVSYYQDRKGCTLKPIKAR